MKLFRRLSALTMVLALLLSMSISVFAADYDAANIDDLWTAFNDTSGEDVNINLTTDIDGTADDGGYYGVGGQDGINYNIRSDNDSSIGNIFFYSGESVTVDVAVEGFIHFDTTNATINQDVNGNVDTYNANVEVNGDVNGGIGAYMSDVSVSGDVSGYVDAYSDGSVAVEGDVNGNIYAGQGGQITVGSDVNGSVDAYGDSTVDIAGDVTAEGEDVWVGVSAGENATVTVGGDVTSDTEGVSAWGESTVTVGGNVTAGDNISYEDDEYVYGGTAVNAGDNATVTVGGDAIGGNAEGENYAFGGAGISAWGYEDSAPTVTVEGNVVGGNGSSTSEESYAAQGGSGVQMSGSANVTVGGDAVGGGSDCVESFSIPGVQISCEPNQSAGSLTVEGEVIGGTGDEELGALNISTWQDPEAENQEPVAVPEIDVGAADSVEVFGFGEEEDARIKAELEAAFVKKTDNFHADALWLVRNAEPGSEVTIYAGNRLVITKDLIDAVIENEVTLIVKWNGGEDLVIDKTISGEFTDTYVNLADLAELLKK